MVMRAGMVRLVAEEVQQVQEVGGVVLAGLSLPMQSRFVT